jgi:hypothetical protein
MTSKFYAVVIGAGPGTGASVLMVYCCETPLTTTVLSGRACALRFAKAYPVVLLARTSESYKETVDEINAANGKAIGIQADATDPASLSAAFDKIEKEFPDHKLAAAILNASGGFVRKPFLQITAEELDLSLDINASVSHCSPCYGFLMLTPRQSWVLQLCPEDAASARGRCGDVPAPPEPDRHRRHGLGQGHSAVRWFCCGQVGQACDDAVGCSRVRTQGGPCCSCGHRRGD